MLSISYLGMICQGSQDNFFRCFGIIFSYSRFFVLFCFAALLASTNNFFLPSLRSQPTASQSRGKTAWISAIYRHMDEPVQEPE